MLFLGFDLALFGFFQGFFMFMLDLLLGCFLAPFGSPSRAKNGVQQKFTDSDDKTNIKFEFYIKNWPRKVLFHIFLLILERKLVLRTFFDYVVRRQIGPFQKLGYSSILFLISSYLIEFTVSKNVEENIIAKFITKLMKI